MEKPKNNIHQWCKTIEESMAGIRLKGLKVICPQCEEHGFVITRWIKGPQIKPIYTFHFQHDRLMKVCELKNEETKKIRTKVSIYEDDIRQLITSRKSFILFSGGNDSLATLQYIKEIANEVKRDLTAIYVNTTIGLPENAKYVKKVCKYLDINLKIVNPKIDYFTLVKKWGIPSFKYRWCCRELKIKPIQEYLDTIKDPKVVFDGIRAAESSIRRQYIPIWYHPSFKCLSISPIFYWSDKKVISFVNGNGIPKTFLNSLGTSTECWCGAYKTKSDFEKLFNLDRKMFYKMVEVEEENQGRFTYIYENGQKISLKEIAKNLKK